MSQCISRKHRSALQIAAVLGLLASLLGGCASNAPTKPHPTSGEQAKTLRHLETIDNVDLGSGDFLKAIVAGPDKFNIERPVAIAVRHGKIYIADAGNHGMVLTYDLQKKRISPITGAGEFIADEASDIYVTKDGSFYITDTLGKRVLHLDADGGFLKEFRSGPNISRPIALTVNEQSGEVFIADEVYSKVIVFNQRGEPVRGIGGRGVGEGKFRIITDMIKVPGGFLISDRIELSVQMLSDAGVYEGDFGAKELYFPTALAADKYGRVYVAEKVDSTIKVFLNGEIIDSIGKNGYGDGEFRHISDMKLVDNKLYVADSLNGRIQVFDVLPPATKLGMLQ